MNTCNNKLFIFAGEKSGDLHGAKLVAALKDQDPTLSLAGVAGPHMRSKGINGPLTMEDFEVMGISDVLLSLPKLYRHFKTICTHILREKYQAIVLIDYPGFNLRLAKALRKKGYTGKIVQYISPTVWAHGKERIGLMSQHFDLLLTIYPFEKPYFEGSGLPVEYIGAPLTEQLALHHYNTSWKKNIHLPKERPLMALFPGSRKNEVQTNLPVMLSTAEKILAQNPEIVFGLSISSEKSLEIAQQYVNKCTSKLQKSTYYVPREYTYELMQESRSAIAKSGTVTLELALHNCPTVVIYQLSTLNRFYASYILKLNLPFYCIVNILTGQETFPELIANQPTSDSLFDAIISIDSDTPKRQQCIQTCKKLHEELKGPIQPSLAGARAILNLLKLQGKPAC